MTNSQLYLAVGLPVFAIVVALVVNLVQITGIKTDVGSLRGEMNGLRSEVISLRGEMNGLRGEMNGLRGEMNSLRGEINDLRGDMNSLRSELNTKLDLILAKLYEHDTDIARLKDKTGLR